MKHHGNICKINGAEVEPDECVERNPTDGRTGTRKGGLMRTPDEIVKALRVCGSSDQCDGCAYLPDDYHDGCYLNCPNGLKIDAAALIESLQAQIDESQRRERAAIKDLKRWIPVTEKLPESGEHVLFSCEVRPGGKRYVCDGYYAKEKSIECAEPDCAIEYDEEADKYYLFEGFYEIVKNWDDFSSVVIGDFVTHWMPLPAAPEEGDSSD